MYIFQSYSAENNGQSFKVDIYYDPDPYNPREEHCNQSTMVCYHRSYNLGDKFGEKIALDYLFDRGIGDKKYNDAHNNPQMIYALLEEQGAVVLPLFLYDHSGITISTTPFNCPWDSGQVGFVFITKEQAQKEFGWKRLSKQRRAKLKKIIRSEVDEYRKFLEGDVYGFKAAINNEEVDSCWGFFGFDIEAFKDYLPEEFRNILN